MCTNVQAKSHWCTCQSKSLYLLAADIVDSFDMVLQGSRPLRKREASEFMLADWLPADNSGGLTPSGPHEKPQVRKAKTYQVCAHFWSVDMDFKQSITP
jgi:hypothetical protein